MPIVTEVAPQNPQRFSLYKRWNHKLTMTKYLRNSGKAWSSQEEKQLKSLAKENTPTRVIGLKLGRSENSIRDRASDLSVSLKPTNQSPYNRKK